MDNKLEYTMKRENDLRGQAAASSTTGAESPSPAKKLRALLGSNEEGQALIETAIALTVFLMILTGAFAFCIVFYQELTLQQAVSAGARSLAQNQGENVTDPCTAATTALESSAPNFAPSKLTITFYENGAPVSGSSCLDNLVPPSTVGVTATYPCSYPIFGVKLGNCQLSASSTQQAE
jgi:Flp pilus assembly protein TadG